MMLKLIMLLLVNTKDMQSMRNKIFSISFLVACLLSIAATTTNPMTPLDETLPIEIHSDSAEFDDKKGTAIYHGDVTMEQGSRQLTSDLLVIHRDTQGKIEMMIATGSPAHFHAKSNPEKPPAFGHANTVKFFPKQDKILLIDNAELTQNADTIRGESLTYYLDTQVLSSEPIPGKRTTVILAPRASKTTNPPGP